MTANREWAMTADPNADLDHDRVGGNCMTCGVKWPCPTVARRMTAAPTGPEPRTDAAVGR